MTKQLLRFMGANEAIRLLSGDRLQNTTNHSMEGHATNSVGFCFSIYSGEADGLYQAATIFSGITDMHVALIGTLKPTNKWVDGEGHYASGWQPEVSICDYGLEDFVEWEMYTPQIDPSPLKMIWSQSWTEPFFAARGAN